MVTIAPSHLRVRKSWVKSVVLVQKSAGGTVERQVLYKPKRKRRVSKNWRKVEKLVRRMSTAQSTAADNYLRRHERSNRKKKNGWLKDLGKNVSRSQRKGMKKIKIRIV